MPLCALAAGKAVTVEEEDGETVGGGVLGREHLWGDGERGRGQGWNDVSQDYLWDPRSDVTRSRPDAMRLARSWRSPARRELSTQSWLHLRLSCPRCALQSVRRVGYIGAPDLRRVGYMTLGYPRRVGYTLL